MAIKYNKDKKYSLGHLEKGIALIKMKRYGEAKRMLNIAQKDFQTKNSVKYWLGEIKKRKKGIKMDISLFSLFPVNINRRFGIKIYLVFLIIPYKKIINYICL